MSTAKLRYMNPKWIRLGLALALAVAGFVAAKVDGREMLPFEEGEDRWDLVVEALDLREEQVEPVQEAFAAFRESRREILKRHGIERGDGKKENFKKARKAAPELKAAKRELEDSLEQILDEEQMDAYREQVKEARKKIGKALKEKRKDAADTN